MCCQARHFVLPPIVAAVSAGQLMTIDVLCEETERLGGPETVVRLLDQPFGPENLTALHVCVTRRDLRTAMHLVKKGARTDIGDSRGQSASELAIANSQQKLGDYLRRVRRVGREVATGATRGLGSQLDSLRERPRDDYRGRSQTCTESSPVLQEAVVLPRS